ncbi:ARM repeat-containing protein [Dissoconium aciculare CBS 342.82]|uniref:ARM repeat-containing protein n=1 Tax=Dissoconium aciculare CBS 342.82 TaxID=1314786 RepID=A0A6J3M986_9PEZI|nr:ARM repeat-containing protein [Dissoconium aciculare CBS 342.82]KAF1824179.1 ARM repeat-containing protein [Dissoconium aciculare CBS 342.82]
MSTPAQTPEQRELSLVGKVEMRIALADTDAKLEALLKMYWAPLLLKLASEHNSVRNKVVSICQHVNTRVQPKSIQLPVAALVKQFREQENAIVRNFDLMYIQQGVGRLSSKEQAELLPIVVSGIAKSGIHSAQIFYLLLRLLDAFRMPARGSKEDVEMRQNMEISDEDASFLSSRLAKFILFSPRKANGVSCPGLTSDEFNFFSVNGKEDSWDPAQGGLNLTRTKTSATKLAASGLLKDDERFFAALFASADATSSISDTGDDMLKRSLPATDLEDKKLVRELFDLYFGNGYPRVKAPLRLKILGLLSKSVKSSTFAAEILQIIDDGISTPQQDGEDTVMSNNILQNPKVGREATKVRAAIFTYVNFVARQGDKQTLSDIASPGVTRLRDFVEDQGWPAPGANEDLVSRGHAYEVIGLLARAGPKKLLVEEDRTNLDLLRWLFSSLAQDTSGNSVTVSIEEALSTVLAAMNRKRFRSTRYVAVRLANRCLPYSSIRARWVDCLAAGASSDRPEVREEGERGLSPYWFRMLNGFVSGTADTNVQQPQFEDVVRLFFVQNAQVTSEDPAVLVRHTKQLNESSFVSLTAFARRVLVSQAFRTADVKINIDTEWERRLDSMVESDLSARSAIKQHLAKIYNTSPKALDLLLCALFECTVDKIASPESHLVELLALAPEGLIQKHVSRTELLMPTLQSNNHIRRLSAAHAFGLLASHPHAGQQQNDHVQNLLDAARDWRTAVGTRSNVVHGAVAALGYYFSRFCFRNEQILQPDKQSQFLKTLFEIFTDSKDDLLLNATFLAIGQLSMFQCLTPATVEHYTKTRSVSEKLYEKAKTGNEEAILCLGRWSMILPEGNDSDNELQFVGEQLHRLYEIRQAEVHFTVGEAYSLLAAGWKSDALATKLDVGESPPKGMPRVDTIDKLMDRVLANCTDTKPALKKAAVMWLLCLVQFCGGQDEIQSRLSKCQNAFRRCLADRDELVQESASRGLGLVYEKGDRSLKDDLVRDLVSSFSSDRQQLAGNVSQDTQLFEPGALPTGDGSVSTYKDIMSLASEVGDSSLVYKFMSMASSNAIWSSRAAFGRFGLSSVLSDSSVDGYLANNPKLYPKLFRYRFDPNGGVQTSMNEIWKTLVPDPAATIDQHFNAIMDDLLVSILGKEWRVRQACCAAIADLVQGRALEKYEDYLERIWTQCFRVLDDIKESVRAAAGSLARTLTGVLTRALEADHSSTKNASTMLKHVLPFLLSPSGMESSAQDVQLFSVHTLLEIIKKANGATIRPFIPELVERLIGLLSSLEPEAVNYVHLNAAKYNLTEQKIDDMRLSSVRSSPLMEAIERCLDLLDDETMRLLQPKLESAMKSAVGLPSKVGSSRVLVSLSTRRMILFKPYVDDNLKLIEKLVIDRNETVASSYAAAAGYLARGASDKQIERLLEYVRRLYFESEGDREGTVPRRSITSGEIVYAFSKYATDRFNAFATSALPFIFVAKHDSHEVVKERFQETWNESVGGSRAVQLYLNEIIGLCTRHLDSAQWTLKHTAARAVAAAINAASSSEVEMSADAGRAIWPALEKALAGKTWEGKEVVLVAFGRYAEAAKQYYMQNDTVRGAMIKIALREAKRQNANYRPHAVKALARISRAREDLDISKDVFEISNEILSDGADPDAMEVDGVDQKRKAEET